MTYPIPSNGDLNWGTELNNYLTNVVQAGLDSTETSLASHTSAAPVTATSSDPHGDRAYAQSLMAPIQANVNKGSGFVQLTAGGMLPSGNWQDLRPVGPAFTSTGTPALLPPQYLATMTGRVELAGYVYIASATYNGQRVFTAALPVSLRPNHPVTLLVTLNQAGTSTSYQPPMVTIGTDGSVTLSGCPGGLAAGTAIGLFGSYPLDAYYTLIQS